MAALPTFVRLLEGIQAAAPASSSMVEQGSAALCLVRLAGMVDSVPADKPAEAAALLPATTAALTLGSRLIYGDRGTSGPLGCSCCLMAGSSRSAAAGSSGGSGSFRAAGGSGAAAAPVLSLQRATLPLPHCQESSHELSHGTGDTLGSILRLLSCLHVKALTADHHPLAGHRGGWLLVLQQFALKLLHLRQQRAAGAQQGGRSCSGSASSSSNTASSLPPSCADPVAAFLCGAGPAALDALTLGQPAADVMLLVYAIDVMGLLQDTVASGAQMCPRCTAEQLLLVVEGATALPHLALTLVDSHGNVFRPFKTMVEGKAGVWPWLPAFHQKAAPALAAWVVAAAQQLPVRHAWGGAAACGGGSSSGETAAAELGLHVISMLSTALHGLARAPHPHRHLGVPLEQLLGCAERALRMQPAWKDQALCIDFGLGVVMVSRGGRGGGGGWVCGWDRHRQFSTLYG